MRPAAGLLATLLAIVVPASPAAAQTRVSLCQSDTQQGTGINLAQALVLGGQITFDCPPQTTIWITRGHRVPAGTAIDGADQVVLDARDAKITMFHVPTGSFSLRRLIITRARTRARPGMMSLYPQSVVDSGGELVLEGVTIQDSDSPVDFASGRISDSHFLRNRGTAVVTGGSVTIERSRFIANATGLAIDSGTVRDCLFSQNTAGAITVRYPASQVTIAESTFEQNTAGAILLSQRSARNSTGVVTISRNTFSSNSSSRAGGAISIYDTVAEAAGLGMSPAILNALRRLPPARFVLAYNRFLNNHGHSGGAISADLANTNGMVVRGGIFVANRSGATGGAIAWIGRSVVITQSVFRSNRAGSGGSALYAASREPDATWSVANSLIVENVSSSGGGAIEADGASLINLTVARNTGIGVAASASSGPLAIANTILSQNTSGNCRGIPAGSLKAGNLQFDGTDCPGVKTEDPQLDELYAPPLESPARRLGDLGVCRADPVSSVDMLFQSRGVDAVCSAGALERPPVRRAMAAATAGGGPTTPPPTLPPVVTPPPQTDEFPGGFAISSGVNSLSIGATAQVRASLLEQEELDRDTVGSGVGADDGIFAEFDIPRLRLRLAGGVYRPWLKYAFEFELNRSPGEGGSRIKDARIDIRPHDHGVQLTIGQFKVPFGLQQLTPFSRQQFVDRAITSDKFASGREVGMSLSGTVASSRAGYAIGLFNGSGESSRQFRESAMWAARAFVDPFGSYALSEGVTGTPALPKLHLGVAIRGGAPIRSRGTPGVVQHPDSQLAVAAEFAFRTSIFFSTAEFFRMTDEQQNPARAPEHRSRGYHAQAGLAIVPQTFEGAIRYARITADTAVAESMVTEVRGGFNYYWHSHNLKLQADFGQLRYGSAVHLLSPRALAGLPPLGPRLVNGVGLVDTEVRVQLQVLF